MADQDLYRVLGVSRSAGADEIKKAYRKLARRYHPDVNPGNKEAEERFKEISQAHDILTDSEKRKVYDEFGMAGLQAGFDPARARAYSDWNARPAPGAEGGTAGGFGHYANFDDIFGDIFGPAGRSGSQPGHDTEASLEIDFLDAVRGISTELTIDRPHVCATCGGSGHDRTSEATCPDCEGKGRISISRGPIAFERACPRCHGQGRVATRECPTCHGRGQLPEREQLRVRIPAGVDNGSRIRVAGKGAPGLAGGPAGDLYIVIAVRPHPLLERRGNDLYLDLPVTVGEAMLGSTITVPTPTGGEVRVRVSPGSQSGKRLRIRGHGAPDVKSAARGDFYLRLMVQVPVDGDERVQEAVRAVESAYTNSPRSGLRL